MAKCMIRAVGFSGLGRLGASALIAIGLFALSAAMVLGTSTPPPYIFPIRPFRITSPLTCSVAVSLPNAITTGCGFSAAGHDLQQRFFEIGVIGIAFGVRLARGEQLAEGDAGLPSLHTWLVSRERHHRE